MKSRVWLALALGAWLAPASALAFCRTTTCNPKEEKCPRDSNGCMLEGKPLFWASSCITLSVQEDASAVHGISYDDALGVLSEAIETWRGAECEGGGSPSIRAELSEAVECTASESNPDGQNANILVFREDGWPYVGAVDAYGYTLLRFGVDTGRLVDADIEINASGDPLSVGDPVMGADLASVVTHELGHLLGLDHSATEAATMYSMYREGDDSLRTLDDDDVTGICSVYPPDREPESTSCEPRGGFSKLCLADQPPPSVAGAAGVAGTGGMPEEEPPLNDAGCSLAAGPRDLTSSPVGWQLGLAGLAALLRRRSIRNPKVAL